MSLDSPRWTAGSTIALALIVAGTATSLIWFGHPYFDFTIDGSIYIVTARSLLAGEGYSHLGHPFVLRPPGFPVLLTPILALFGTRFWVMNLYVSLFGVLCVALLFVYARPRLGVPVAAAVAVVAWLNPVFQRLCHQVMSDVPGASLMLACLVVERWARRNPFPRRDLVLGLCIAGAAYVRTLNVLLIPAIVASRIFASRSAAEESASWTRFGVREALLLTVVPLIALLPWSVRNGVNPPPSPAEQTADYSYWTATWHADRSDPNSPLIGLDDLLQRVPARLGEVVPILGSRMRTKEGGLSDLVLGGMALLCWLAVLARRRSAGEWFVGGTLIVLAIYVSVIVRLVLPLYLLVLPAVAEAALWILSRFSGPRLRQGLVTGLLGLLALHDFGLEPDRSFLRRRDELHAEVSAYVAGRFPPDVPIAAVVGDPFSVYLDRPVYNLRPEMERQGLQGALQILDKHRVGVAIIAGVYPGLLAYLSERTPPERRFGPLWVFRIDDPGALGARPAERQR